jgi:hypothetical protein
LTEDGVIYHFDALFDFNLAFVLCISLYTAKKQIKQLLDTFCTFWNSCFAI